VDGIRVPAQRDYVDPAWHLYPVRILGGRRREIFEGLRAAGIGVQVNYIPVYWHPVFANAGYQRGLCPNAEQYYREEISLPMFPDLTDAQVDQVIETLTKLVS
jgi:dTDP-4-amino-4,6-dideoxygalactose transaminase